MFIRLHGTKGCHAAPGASQAHPLRMILEPDTAPSSNRPSVHAAASIVPPAANLLHDRVSEGATGVYRLLEPGVRRAEDRPGATWDLETRDQIEIANWPVRALFGMTVVVTGAACTGTTQPMVCMASRDPCRTRMAGLVDQAAGLFLPTTAANGGRGRSGGSGAMFSRQEPPRGAVPDALPFAARGRGGRGRAEADWRAAGMGSMARSSSCSACARAAQGRRWPPPRCASIY